MLPLKAKQLIHQTATHYAVGWIISKYFGEKIPNWDCEIFVPGREISLRVVAKIYWRFYEKAEIQFIRKHLRADLDVLELGSSIGVVACHIAKKIKPGKRIICLEANSRLIPFIKRNLTLNAPEVNAIIINAAIDYSGSQHVGLTIGATNTDSIISAQSKKHNQIKATTLCEMANEYQLDEFSLVCDIEGSEWGMIKNELSTLKRCRQLIIELHPYVENRRLIGVEKMKDLLISAHGFTFCRNRGNVFLFNK